MVITHENSHELYMRAALALAESSAAAGEVPVGALVVLESEIIGESGNESISAGDPTAHAEILAIRRSARRVGNYRLAGSILYTTLEPCAMCAGAIVWARIERVVVALRDPKAGAAGSVLDVIPNAALNHRPVIEFGPCEEESRELLTRFFKDRR